MNPNTEPGALPGMFDNWQEWRETYAAYVAEFQRSDRTAVPIVILRKNLRRLGYAGARLDEELNFIKEQN